MNLNNPGLLTHFTSRFTFVLLEDVLSASPPETSDFRDSETYFMPLCAAESVLVKVKFVAVWSSPPTQNHDKWSQIRLFRPRLTTTIMTVVKIRIHIVRNFFMLTSSLKNRSASEFGHFYLQSEANNPFMSKIIISCCFFDYLLFE